MGVRRWKEMVRWLVPGAAFALVPSCPVELSVHVGSVMTLTLGDDAGALLAAACVAVVVYLDRRS